MRSTHSDTPAIPYYFRLRREFFHSNTPYIKLEILRVKHSIKRALRSTVAMEAQRPLLDLYSKRIPMGTRTPALAQNVGIAAGMVVIAGSLRQIISKWGYSAWYAPVQSLERHRACEMLSRIDSIRRGLKGRHVPRYRL